MHKAEAFFLCFLLLGFVSEFRENRGVLHAQELEDPGLSNDPGLDGPDSEEPAYGDPGLDEPEYTDPGYTAETEPDEPVESEPDYEEEVPIEGDYTGYVPELYSRGDQIFAMTLGIVFPAGFTTTGGASVTHNLDPVGGTGSLSYMYFLDPHWFLGGEIGGVFIGTIAKSMYFLVPIGVRAGYQFVIKRFEIPLTASIGIAPQTYLDQNYLGLYTKLGGSVYFRFNPDWSFGLNTAWWWVPQWNPDRSKNVNGNFMELTLSARYHF